MTLVEFLLARIAEDEAMPARVTYDIGFDHSGPSALYLWDQESDGHGSRDPSGVGVSAARVLAECEAKRQIAVEHMSCFPEFGGHLVCATCRDNNEGTVAYPCLTLRLVTAPYADHPDYDPSWRL